MSFLFVLVRNPLISILGTFPDGKVVDTYKRNIFWISRSVVALQIQKCRLKISCFKQIFLSPFWKWCFKIEKYLWLLPSNSRTAGFERTAMVWFCCVDFKFYVSIWHHALVV